MTHERKQFAHRKNAPKNKKKKRKTYDMLPGMGTGWNFIHLKEECQTEVVTKTNRKTKWSRLCQITGASAEASIEFYKGG